MEASIAAEAQQGPVQEKVLARLSPEVYKSLVSQLPGAVIDKQAPDAGCDAAFKLGVQFVLNKLRDGFVIE